MSVVLDSGLIQSSSIQSGLTDPVLTQPGAKHGHPDFDVAVTLRLLVMVAVMMALVAAGLYFYGEIAPGV